MVGIMLGFFGSFKEVGFFSNVQKGESSGRLQVEN